MSTRLSDIAVRLEQAGLLVQAPAFDADVLDISDDSRAVRSGALFCAWAGNSTDAHAFVAAAAEAGAAGAIVERAVPEARVLNDVNLPSRPTGNHRHQHEQRPQREPEPAAAGG